MVYSFSMSQGFSHRGCGIVSFVFAAILVLGAARMPARGGEATGVRLTGLDKRSDCLFVRGEVFGLATSRASIVDTFVTTNLLAEWSWIDANRLGAGTNATAVLIVPQVLEMTNMPDRLFVRMTERLSENGDMRDRDSDGSPNVYEIHHGTNPYVADFEDASRVTVPPNCEYAAFTNALWSSAPYSIVEIAGEMYFDESVDLPGWPLLITGPTNGYAVIHSGADIGVFMVNRRQTNHTLVRNVYLTMDRTSSFQAGFWIGGNLPWSTDAAGASFENVRLRMYNPGTWYYGWHMYGGTDTPVVIRNCTVSAAGATDVLPVYVYGDSQVVVTNGLALVNMPGCPPSEGYTWAGYSLSERYSSLRDSDGDGINDHDEVFVHGTDPYLRDSDGDRIADLDEIRHGACPTNQGVYCFLLTITATNAYADVGRLKFAFYDPASDVRLVGPAEMTNRAEEVALHCLVNGAGSPTLRMWGAEEETYVSIPYAVKGHDNGTPVSASLVGQLYDADGDELPDVWEVVHGLSPRDADDALEDVDGDGLINLHEYWASSDPWKVDATNTLLSLCARSVDARLSGKDPAVALHKFCNYQANGTNFVLSADFWADDVDTSCVSMWNDAGRDIWGGVCSSWNMAGTAISRRHIITAWHYAIPTGSTVWFMGNDGVPCSRVVMGHRSIAGTDICIQLLDGDLPDTVEPTRILPENYADYIRTAARLPVVTFDQEEKLVVADSRPFKAYSDRNEVTGALCPHDSTRLAFYENVVSGDSGNPRFLVVGNQLVLLSVLRSGGTGSGCFVSHYADEIQQAMDILCPGYQLERMVLEDYEALD